ncbi:MAG: BTAD domain-containing putative transcriptional regulator [Sulfurimicrobium sp.]|nr:BTAD domain-containing putative transcriptional regulator [Sulfurimicrobium sp.]MDP1703742.1 BTAD domain-containing putative transcriptional regulator [Sulfurimicrobium sp.]MDP2200346.1 BTAD domain-containing putative transcriptional regulator [Sulfurimicrobium sp.]
MIQSLENMLATGKESALLRFSLGSEYLKEAQAEPAAAHLQRAVELDPVYSAAWKLLGKALLGAGRKVEALAAYRQGIVVAETRGDKQAAKEMTVFARRIEKELGASQA